MKKIKKEKKDSGPSREAGRQARMTKEIMGKIIKGEVKMRPKWEFVAWTAGIKGGLVLMILGGGLILAILIYLVELMNLGELLEFGDLGWEIIRSDFPYGLLAGVVTLISGGIFLYSKIGENYKKTTRKVILIIGGAIVLLVAILTIIRTREELEILLGFT